MPKSLESNNIEKLLAEAVDFVLRYRNRIKTIQRRLDEMEQLINSTDMYLTPETLNLNLNLNSEPRT